jgi:cell division protein FtsB
LRYTSVMHAKQWRRGFIVCVLLLVAFWLLSLIVGLVDKAKIAVDEMHNVQRKYQALEDRRQILEANLASIETSRGQDSAIRTAFGVARPGEEVIVVVPPTTVAPTTTPTLWQKIMDWLK